MNDKLGMIALSTDGHPRGLTPKLDSVGTDPEERFYMLATFCFDLSRKLKYISLALRDYFGQEDPEFAEKILRDEKFINPKPDILPWEAMAIRAEQVMKRLHQELLDAGYPPYPPEEGGRKY